MSEPINGDRTRIADSPTMSETAGQKKRAAIAIGLAVALAGSFSLLVWLRPEPKRTAPVPTIRQTTHFEPAAPPPPPAKPAEAIVTASLPQAAASPPPPAIPVETLLDSARRAPVTAYSRKGVSETGAARSSLGEHGETEDKGAFERRFEPPRMKGARATGIGDRRFIVAQGTSIPCVLETALQSDQPGFCSCIITRDVLSDNGQVVLMEKGTQVVGQYRGGLQQGQQRLHVLWSRAKTPAGVIVELGSAGTDALGRAGFGGMIDNHWWERFGSALLLSVIGDASKAATQIAQERSGYSVANTGNSGKEAAAIAVEQSASIKPTLHKNQGELVAIFVARDLDFSSVYRLTTVPYRGEGPNTFRSAVVLPAAVDHGGLK